MSKKETFLGTKRDLQTGFPSADLFLLHTDTFLGTDAENLKSFKEKLVAKGICTLNTQVGSSPSPALGRGPLECVSTVLFFRRI
jgi:hypothetical protein